MFASEDELERNVQDDYDENVSPIRPQVRTIKRPKPLIIIISNTTTTSSASSALLNRLTAQAVLPNLYHGKQSCVAYIDCVNSFSATYLYRTVLTVLRKSNSATASGAGAHIPISTLTTLAKDALKHVHVLRATSSRSLLTILQELPKYLLDGTAHSSSTRSLGMVIVNGINHFHWQDRFDAEMTRLDGLGVSAGTGAFQTTSIGPSSDVLAKQILSKLKQIQGMFECSIVYTSTNIPTNTSSTDNHPRPPAHSRSGRAPDAQMMDTSPLLEHQYSHTRSHTSNLYTKNALLTIKPRRNEAPQFAPQMSLEECLGDRSKRAEAVKKAGWWYSVEPGGLAEKTEVRNLGQKTGFTL